MTTPDSTTPEPPDDPPSGDSSGRRSLAGHLSNPTVLAALIAAVATVVVAVLQLGSNDDNSGAPENKPAVTSGSQTGVPVQPAESDSPSLSDTPAPSAPVTSDSNASQYTRTVRIAETGPDLDVDPPKLDHSSQDVRLALIDPPRITGYGVTSQPSLALWSGSAMPTRKECSDLLSTQGVPTVEVKKGTVVCIQTDAGRIAVLTITSTSNDFSTGEMAQVTVWSEVSN